MTIKEAADQFGAQFYLTLPDAPKTPQLFYRWETVMRNDRSVHTSLQYLTFCNLWQCSEEDDHQKFAKEHLIPIPGVTPHDPVKVEADLRIARERLDRELEAEEWWNSEGRGDCPKWHRISEELRTKVLEARKESQNNDRTNTNRIPAPSR